MKKEEKNRKKDLTNGERCGKIVKLSLRRQPTGEPVKGLIHNKR